MYDSIVVGAGPSGGSASYHLAKRGRSVLLLEKESLPRYKPCGGALSPIIQEWFDFDFSPAVSLKLNKINYTWQMGSPEMVEIATKEPVWMVRRDIFDHYLVQQAQKLGVELRDRTNVNGIEWKSDRWLVKTDNDVFEAKYLIAADGAKGQMSKWLGFKEPKRRKGVMLEVKADLSQQVGQNLFADKLNSNFDFGSMQNGFVWSFPKADGYSIGSTTFMGNEKQDLFEICSTYVNHVGLEKAEVEQSEHPICLWNGNQSLHTQNALLTGETACILDPFTAEGIRPSLFTGMLAGQAIDEAIAGNADALKQYTLKVHEEWGADMAWSQRIAGIFYRVPSFGYKMGMKRPSATQRMGKILCGEMRYRDVAGAAINRLTKGLIPGMG
ncbi:geranylgeranyl reductase family protein [Pseudanabaena biceps]|nr:geranylgeranyl reductase family protein [Pseudanabaena biceps]